MKVLYYVLGAVLGVAAGLLFTGCSLSNRDIYVGTARYTMRMLNPDNEQSGGTGFLLTLPSGNTVIMTNAHVCNMTTKPYIISDFRGAKRRAQILEVARDTDLCILQAPVGTTGLRLASSARIFDQIHVVGHPYLLPITYSEGFINNRESMLVSYCELVDNTPQLYPPGGHPQHDAITDLFMPDCVKPVDAFYMSARTAPGNSGSPVVNDSGDVVGVLFAGGADGFVSAAIPLPVVERFLAGH